MVDVVRWLIKSSLELVDTRYYTQTRLSYGRCWTGSSPVIRQYPEVVNDFGNLVEPVIQDLDKLFVNFVDMDIPLRSTRKYLFKKTDLLRLRELASLVSDPVDFQAHHGKLLRILRVDVEEGCLETLVQFYDPLYHCFTFPDYQLVPTLEEYSYLVGLPVPDKIPFHGFEPTPKPSDIAAALHLKTSIIQANLTSKGGLQGLPTHFLYQQASIFAEAASILAFHSILALLIYGLLLFPNIDNFIDINAIKIFLTKNPVPTLLADTYHSIHDRTQAGRGTISCCAPLLYQWFTFHLPQSRAFKTNDDKLSWPRRIMTLDPSDIVWYQAASDVGEIIVSCGEYPNVPLLGMRGGISYNPLLARRQFGYPIKTKPNNLALTNEFYLNHGDHSNKRERFAQAWSAIRRLNRSQLGKKSDYVHESYTQWVIDRTNSFGLPYRLPRYLSSTIPPSSLPIPFDTKALDRKLQVDWARDAREGPRVLMSLRTHLLLEVASPLSFPFSIPLPFIFQEAKESIDEEDPRPTSSNGACITKEEFHEQLTKERQEKETWKRRCQELEQENETLKGKIAQQSRELFIQNQRMIEKDDLLRRKDALLHRDARRKRRFMDLFSRAHSDSEDPSTPGFMMFTISLTSSSIIICSLSFCISISMHHVAFMSHTVFTTSKGGESINRRPRKVARRVLHKPTRIYNTRANRKRMDIVEQENQSLRKEVATLREGMDRLTTMMSALLSAQNSQAAAATVEQPLVSTTPLSTVTSPPLFLPPGCTWGMPPPVCGSPQPTVSEVPPPFAQQSAPGRLTGESAPAASNAKKFGGHFAKKKDQEVGMVAHGKPQQNFTPYRQVANVASTIPNPSYHQQRPHYPQQYPPHQYPPQQYPPQQYPPHQYPPQQYLPQQYPPQQYHQPQYPQKQQNRPQTPQQPYHSQNRQKTTFDPIPMKYADLLPALLAKNLVQVRTPPRTPDVLPPWFRHDLTCAFHQGAPGHDVENCYVLKNEVQKLVRANLLSFKDQNPNVQANPLPNHGPAVNMIQDCDEDGVILNVQHIRTPLVPIHIKMCEAALFDHDHAACEICPVNVKGCPKVQGDIQGLIDSRELTITRKDREVCVITPEFQRLEISYNSGESTTTPLVISLPGPMPYASLKAVPYKYSATMLEGSATNSVGSSSITSTFCSAGFINNSPEANAVLEDAPEEIVLAFVTPGKLVRNWDAVDIPSVVHASK
ncbi:hypothetical protein HKD37_15G043466 [Glycine soja]